MKYREYITLTLPVMGALLFSGWVIDRLFLAIAGTLLLSVAMRSVHFRYQRSHIQLVGIGGAALGALALIYSNTPRGTLPPFLLSPVAGAFSSMAIWACLARNLTISWGSASVLLACATSTTATSDQTLLGCALLFIYFAALAAQSFSFSLLRAGLFILYCGAVILGGQLAFQYQEEHAGWLFPLIESFIDKQDVSSGFEFDSDIKLSAYSDISLSNEAVLDVAGDAPQYLRSHVMDTFDGYSWTSSDRVIQLRNMRPASLTSGQAVTLSFLSDMRSIIPIPAGTMIIQGRRPRFTTGWLTIGSPRQGDVLELKRLPRETLPREESPASGGLIIPTTLAKKLKPYAQQIVGDTSNPLAQAAIMEKYFTSRYRYSLQTDLRGDDHPLIILIRDKKPAYCIYYASAMAALLRSNGVHSRVIGGFLLPSANTMTDHTMVRQRDGHAWVEVWSPTQRRWVNFDPTPAQGDLPPQSNLKSWLEGISDTLLRVGLRLIAQPDKVVWECVTSWPAILIFMAAVLWSIWLRIKRSRAQASKNQGSRRLTPPDVQSYYRQYEKLIKRYTGLQLGSSESEQDFLDRLNEAAPRSLSAAQHFISMYQKARYGQGDSERLASALHDLKRSLHRKTSD